MHNKNEDRLEEFIKKISVLEDMPELHSFVIDLIAAFCYSVDGVCIVDQEGNIIMSNPAFEELSGCSKEELQKKNVRELVEQGMFNPSVALKVIQSKQEQTITQTNKSGKITLSTGKPLFDEQGNVKKVISNIRDITLLNRLSEELIAKNALLENQGRIADSTLRDLPVSIVRESEGTKSIVKLASRVAETKSTVLILGESGVGKGVFAKLIYQLSARSDKPFISLNCSAIPEQLLESELFGYNPGAFTGANRLGKVGLIEAADGGTLFLDEIGELPITLQPKLLHFLETGEITRVGATKSKTLDVRVIAATNRELSELVAEGRFRKDLYYRLNVVPIWIPPLRERKEDIVPLILQAIKKYNDRNHKKKRISHETFEILANYSWPGNVRELLNLIERLLVLSESDEIRNSDLPVEIRRGGVKLDMYSLDKDITLPVSMPHIISGIEETLIKRAFEKGGSIRAAAKLLGVTPSTLFRRMHK